MRIGLCAGLAVCLFLGRVEAEDISAPDYSAWKKTHTCDGKVVFKGGENQINLKDEHYEKSTDTTGQRYDSVMVIWNEQQEQWLLLYIIDHKKNREDVYLFEQKDGKWQFTKDIGRLTLAEQNDFFEKQYHIIFSD